MPGMHGRCWKPCNLKPPMRVIMIRGELRKGGKCESGTMLFRKATSPNHDHSMGSIPENILK